MDSYQEKLERTIFILTELADRLEREEDRYLHNVDCLRAWLYQITKVYRNQLMTIGEE